MMTLFSSFGLVQAVAITFFLVVTVSDHPGVTAFQSITAQRSSSCPSLGRSSTFHHTRPLVSLAEATVTANVEETQQAQEHWIMGVPPSTTTIVPQELLEHESQSVRQEQRQILTAQIMSTKSHQNLLPPWYSSTEQRRHQRAPMVATSDQLHVTKDVMNIAVTLPPWYSTKEQQRQTELIMATVHQQQSSTKQENLLNDVAVAMPPPWYAPKQQEQQQKHQTSQSIMKTKEHQQNQWKGENLLNTIANTLPPWYYSTKQQQEIADEKTSESDNSLQSSSLQETSEWYFAQIAPTVAEELSVVSKGALIDPDTAGLSKPENSEASMPFQLAISDDARLMYSYHHGDAYYYHYYYDQEDESMAWKKAFMI